MERARPQRTRRSTEPALLERHLEDHNDNLKTLLLVSAASYVTVGVVVAADLPVKAKPVEYVQVCTLYGDGYYYIPGTDTCIKIGGYLRAEVDVNAGGTLTPRGRPGDRGQSGLRHGS
jgi:hypothetical protein